MKNYLLLLTVCLLVKYTKATNYYFIPGSDNQWTNIANWTPSYPGLAINAGDSVFLSEHAILQNSALNLNGVLKITHDFSYWGFWLKGTSSLNVGSTGIILNQGYLRMYNTSQLNISGTVNVSGNLYETIYMEDTSSIVINASGDLYVQDSIYNGYPAGAVSLGTTTITVNGILTNDGIIYNDGTINGIGTIQTSTSLSNGLISGIGTVAPGLSPGELKTDFDYALSNNGSLTIEIGGLLPGTQYDVLAGNGHKMLNGKLKVLLYGTYTPNIGDEFVIIKGDSVSGTFDTIEFPTLPGSMIWNISYEPDMVRIKVNSSTGILDDITIGSPIIWPNPNHGEFYVQGINSDPHNYTIYSLLGEILQSGIVKKSEPIQLNSNIKGMMLLVLSDQNNNVSKIIIETR